MHTRTFRREKTRENPIQIIMIEFENIWEIRKKRCWEICPETHDDIEVSKFWNPELCFCFLLYFPQKLIRTGHVFRYVTHYFHNSSLKAFNMCFLAGQLISDIKTKTQPTYDKQQAVPGWWMQHVMLRFPQSATPLSKIRWHTGCWETRDWKLWVVEVVMKRRDMVQNKRILLTIDVPEPD